MVTLFSHNTQVLSSISWSGVCSLSPCWCGFPPGSLVSPTVRDMHPRVIIQSLHWWRSGSGRQAQLSSLPLWRGSDAENTSLSLYNEVSSDGGVMVPICWKNTTFRLLLGESINSSQMRVLPNRKCNEWLRGTLLMIDLLFTTGTGFSPTGSPSWQSCPWQGGCTRTALCFGIVLLSAPFRASCTRWMSSPSPWRRRWLKESSSDPDPEFSPLSLNSGMRNRIKYSSFHLWEKDEHLETLETWLSTPGRTVNFDKVTGNLSSKHPSLLTDVNVVNTVLASGNGLFFLCLFTLWNSVSPRRNRESYNLTSTENILIAFHPLLYLTPGQLKLPPDSPIACTWILNQAHAWPKTDCLFHVGVSVSWSRIQVLRPYHMETFLDFIYCIS